MNKIKFYNKKKKNKSKIYNKIKQKKMQRKNFFIKTFMNSNKKKNYNKKYNWLLIIEAKSIYILLKMTMFIL